MIRSPSLLLRNIEYNGTSINRSSLISQTQALNPYTPHSIVPLKYPVKNNSTLCKCHKVLSPIWIFRIISTNDYMSFYRDLITMRTILILIAVGKTKSSLIQSLFHDKDKLCNSHVYPHTFSPEVKFQVVLGLFLKLTLSSYRKIKLEPTNLNIYIFQ